MTSQQLPVPLQLQGQQTLSDIALQLNATLDLDKLLTYAANAASVLAESEAAFILLPDEKGNLLSLKSHYNVSEEPLKVPFQDPIKMNLSLEGRVLRSGQPYILGGEENPEEWAFWTGQGVKAVLYVPMISRKETVGILVLCYLKRTPEFSKYEIKTLRQLASHAAVAIENARTYADSQARSFELAVIMDATEAVNSTLSLPQVLSLVGKNLQKALHINWCEVLTLDNPGQIFMTLSSQREASWHPDYTLTLDIAKLPHFNLSQATPQLLRSTTKGLTQDEFILLDHAQLTLVKWLHNEEGLLLGALQLLYLEDVQEAPEQIFNTLQSLVREIASRVNDQDNGRTMYLMHQVLRDIPAMGCRLWRYDGSFLKLKLDESNFVWNQHNYPIHSTETYPSLRSSIRRQAFYNVVVEDFSLADDLARLMKQRRLKVLLVLPFAIQDEKQGLMLIGDTQRTTRFEKRELGLAQGFVLQAANALKNAYLFEDLQNSLEELRRTQAKLVQTARLSAIGELAAAVAHQINNPLTTILGDTQLLLEDTPPEDVRHESLKAIHRAGQRAYEVVRRLLTMSRQKAPDDKPELMNINLTIENTLALVRDTMQRARTTLTVNLAENLPRAYGLSGQLEDVWLNLILNARDAIRQMPNPMVTVELRFDVANNRVEVTVADNGPGLGNADPAQIFQAFYTTKPAGEGTGLGLYICATVVERCGGKIKVGVSPQNGALFTVILPCQATNLDARKE